MRTLSEVFAPGAPTLPEGLRTLVVSPERELEPGMTVRAAFTFRNQGGAVATGVRVRFTLPATAEPARLHVPADLVLTDRGAG